MNDLFRIFMILSLFFLCNILILAQTHTPPANIETHIYDEDNYTRTDLFEEQDLIYGNRVSYNQGLELICFQDKVKVEITGFDTLYTPVDLDNIPAGDYIVSLIKTGYYKTEFKITITSEERTSVVVNLVPYTTELILKNIPEQAEVYINNQIVKDSQTRVPLGENYLRIFAFGYEDYAKIIDIDTVEDFILEPELKRKEFALKEIVASKPEIWTNDSKSQKKSVISIYADAPGQGMLSIVNDSNGETILSSEIIFNKTKTDYVFDLNNFPTITEGELSIIAKGNGNGSSDELSSKMTIHRGIKSIWRNNFTGFSGFLYSPTAETLPAGSFQLQTSISPLFPSYEIDDFYLPALLSLRASVFDFFEFALGGGIFISPVISASSVNFFVSGKYSFLTTDGSDGFTLATGLSVNYNGKTSAFAEIPPYDPFGGLTGITVTIPLQYRLGKLLFVLTPELKISPAFPLTDGDSMTDNTFYIWNYIRTGMALDFGEVSTAISMALQTPDYGQSTSDWPLFLGLEVNATPGNTGFSYSVYAGFRYVTAESLQITSGISAGFIF